MQAVALKKANDREAKHPLIKWTTNNRPNTNTNKTLMQNYSRQGVTTSSGLKNFPSIMAKKECLGRKTVKMKVLPAAQERTRGLISTTQPKKKKN